MRLSKIALSLAILYALVAFVVAWQDFNCGGGLDINICGLGTAFMTFPSYLTLGWVLTRLGLSINFRHRTPSASDVLQLTLHIIVCGVIVYLIAAVLGRIISLLRVPKHSN